MKIRLVLFFTFLFNLLYAGNVHEKQKSFVNDSDYVNQWSKAISEDMISDGLSPCLASRVFAYSMLSGYITASSLNHLPDLPINTPLSVNIKKIFFH